MKTKYTICKRCGKLFIPEPLFKSGKLPLCCDDCCVKNLTDALGFPTPPDMLDRHTLRPTLTEAEYDEEMSHHCDKCQTPHRKGTMCPECFKS